MRKELEDKIRRIALEELKDLDDCARLDITDEKGIMTMVENWDTDIGLEYFIELNDIDEDCYEPCAEYNTFCEFGNIDKLINVIGEYLSGNDIDVCSDKWEVWWMLNTNMTFTSHNGTKIVFDDWCDETEDEELGGYWVGICDECLNKYNVFENRIDECGSGCCSVKGCRNEADHYVDFSRDEVVFE